MRTLKKPVEIPSRLAGPFERLLAQFSAATLELNPSIGAPEFARRLTARASEMLGARVAVLAVRRGAEWEIAALSGPAHRWDFGVQSRLAFALGEQAAAPAGLRSGSAVRLLGNELADALAWREVVLGQLTGSEGEVLGVLCLADLGRELSAAENQLLEALASHASVAIENAQLFSGSSNHASNGWKTLTRFPISSSFTTPRIACFG